MMKFYLWVLEQKHHTIESQQSSAAPLAERGQKRRQTRLLHGISNPCENHCEGDAQSIRKGQVIPTPAHNLLVYKT